MTLDGKVAIVTGAGRGLGRTEAIELAAQAMAKCRAEALWVQLTPCGDEYCTQS